MNRWQIFKLEKMRDSRLFAEKLTYYLCLAYSNYPNSIAQNPASGEYAEKVLIERGAR